MHVLNTLTQPNYDEIQRLRKDLDAERNLTTKLWMAVGYMQQAIGVALGYGCDEDNFINASNKADEILDGIIALTPADKA